MTKEEIMKNRENCDLVESIEKDIFKYYIGDAEDADKRLICISYALADAAGKILTAMEALGFEGIVKEWKDLFDSLLVIANARLEILKIESNGKDGNDS